MRLAKRKQLIVSGEGIILPVLSTNVTIFYIGLQQLCKQKYQFVIPSKIIHLVGTQLPQNAFLVRNLVQNCKNIAKYSATQNNNSSVRKKWSEEKTCNIYNAYKYLSLNMLQSFYFFLQKLPKLMTKPLREFSL